MLLQLVKRQNAKVAFSLKRCINALPEFNQLLDFFNLFESQLIFMLLYDSLSLVINALGRRDGNRTLRTQDTSVPRHFGTSAEVSRRHFDKVPKCPDSSAPRHVVTKTFRH